MTQKVLSLRKREVSHGSRQLRARGIVPGVLYGVGIKNIPVEVDAKFLLEAYGEAGETNLIEVKVGNKEKSFVFIQQYDVDPVTDNIIHVDFYKPNLEEKIEKSVPLIFEGVSPAVKNEGGILVKNVHELGVRALPQKILHEIRVDLTKLKNVDDIFRVENLNLPADIEVLAEKDVVVAVVEAPRSEEELKALEEAPEEGIESVEGIKKEGEGETPSEEGEGGVKEKQEEKGGEEEGEATEGQ